MIAKMRMQIGETIISWGALPEASIANARNVEHRARLKFAVIEDVCQVTPIVSDTGRLRARSA